MEKHHKLLGKKPKEAMEKTVISQRIISKLSFLMPLWNFMLKVQGI